MELIDKWWKTIQHQTAYDVSHRFNASVWHYMRNYYDWTIETSALEPHCTLCGITSYTIVRMFLHCDKFLYYMNMVMVHIKCRERSRICQRGQTMASTEHQPIKGVCQQRCQRGWGPRAGIRSPPKLKVFHPFSYKKRSNSRNLVIPMLSLKPFLSVIILNF